jgi:hypothetical protein
MTPKEKAKELVLNFKELPQEDTLMFYLTFEISKQCALIAVDEILEAVNWHNMESDLNYWGQVKKELLNL